MSNHRDETFGKSKSKFLWCLHCERAFKNGEYRAEIQDGFEYQMCPYEDCDGTILDQWEWGKIKESHPEYPETPEKDVRYSLYSAK